MSFGAIIGVVGLLRDFDVRLGGGWGVDVLVGRQTREHHDVDLFVPVTEIEPALAALCAAGAVVIEDDRPCRVVLEQRSIGRIDLNGIEFVASGDAFQRDDDRGFELFPANCWTEVAVAGSVIVCLTADAQRTKREGYPIRDVDHHDLTTLNSLDPRRHGADGSQAGTGS